MQQQTLSIKRNVDEEIYQYVKASREEGKTYQTIFDELKEMGFQTWCGNKLSPVILSQFMVKKGHRTKNFRVATKKRVRRVEKSVSIDDLMRVYENKNMSTEDKESLSRLLIEKRL